MSLREAPKDIDKVSGYTVPTDSKPDHHKDSIKELSKGQQGKIASSVRACYTQDIAVKDYVNYVAYLVVTVDEIGEARIIKFDDKMQTKMNNDPAYREFAERSRDAVLNPTCSKLPIPSSMLGQRNTIRFAFRP